MSACSHVLVSSYKCCLVRTRLSVSLHTCLHVPMCLFMYFVHTNQYLHKVLAQSLVWFPLQVCSGHSISLLMFCLHVCVFAHLLVCTCIYLTVHASNCVHICLPVSHVMITFCTNLVAAFSKWHFCLSKCLIDHSSDCLFIQMFACLQVCSWLLLNDA